MNNNILFESEKIKTEVSKMMSYILRHDPSKYGIALDESGYTEIETLINALKESFPWVRMEHVEEITRTSPKKRFEISGKKIRAQYGHSIKVNPVSEEVAPPEYLFHGTSPEFIENIKKEGLMSMNRLWVHLTCEKELAILVGKRHHKNPVILRVKALEAFKRGICFRKEGEIYISGNIPAELIEFPE
jgi:putative RNA 2'-phosphotransferase